MSRSLTAWLHSRADDSIAQWPAASVPATELAAARAAGWIVGEVNATGARTKTELLKRFKRDLDFPATFGHNWDALVDSMSDWHAHSWRRLVVVNGLSAAQAPGLLAVLEAATTDNLAITIATPSKHPNLTRLN